MTRKKDKLSKKKSKSKDKSKSQEVSTRQSLLCCCRPAVASKTKPKKSEILQTTNKEFSDYECEYVIENLAIRKVPKLFLEPKQSPIPKKKSLGTTQTLKPCLHDCSTLAGRCSIQENIVRTPEVVLGPVVEEKASGDGSVAKKISEPSVPCCKTPCFQKQTHYQCLIRDKEKDDFILKKVLLPPSQIQRVEHPRMQVVADVHRVCVEEGKPRNDPKSIPPEIQKILDALKVAKPQLTSPSQRKTQVNLMRSVSDTSCDNKETFCNFLGVEHIRGETTEDTRSSLMDYCSEVRKKSLSKLVQPKQGADLLKSGEVNSMTPSKYIQNLLNDLQVKDFG